MKFDFYNKIQEFLFNDQQEFLRTKMFIGLNKEIYDYYPHNRLKINRELRRPLINIVNFNIREHISDQIYKEVYESGR